MTTDHRTRYFVPPEQRCGVLCCDHIPPDIGAGEQGPQARTCDQVKGHEHAHSCINCRRTIKRCVRCVQAIGIGGVDGVCQTPWRRRSSTNDADNLARRWSVKLHANGVHTNATIRHGTAGSCRALLGSVTLNSSDIESLTAMLTHVSHRVVTHAVLEVVLQLGERKMFPLGPPSPDIIYEIGEACRAKCAELTRETLIDVLNIHKGK